jgi:hypothetical protein
LELQKNPAVMLKRFACLIISLLVVGCNGAADDTGGEKFPTQVPGRDTNPGRVFSNADPKVTAGLPSEFTTATLAGAGARELKPSRGDAAPQGESEDLTVGGRDWPVFRGNLQATGWLPKVTLGPLRERWRFALEKGQFESSPVIAGGLVFAASSGGELVAVGLESGTLVWRARAEGLLRHHLPFLEAGFLSGTTPVFFTVGMPAKGNSCGSFLQKVLSILPRVFGRATCFLVPRMATFIASRQRAGNSGGSIQVMIRSAVFLLFARERHSLPVVTATFMWSI